MSTTRLARHADAAASGGLAAAICLAISQLIALILAPESSVANLAYGLSLSSIAFGGTYAGVFFVRLLADRRAATGPAGNASQPANG